MKWKLPLYLNLFLNNHRLSQLPVASTYRPPNASLMLHVAGSRLLAAELAPKMGLISGTASCLDGNTGNWTTPSVKCTAIVGNALMQAVVGVEHVCPAQKEPNMVRKILSRVQLSTWRNGRINSADPEMHAPFAK